MIFFFLKISSAKFTNEKKIQHEKFFNFFPTTEM